MWEKLFRMLGLGPTLSPLPEGHFLPSKPTVRETVLPPRKLTGGQPTSTPQPTTMPQPTAMPRQGEPTPYPSLAPTIEEFGMGQEQASIQPDLYNALLSLQASKEERRNISELSGQESSYGYAEPHITEKEESYGPFHINLKAGRVDPTTGEAFTREGAENIQNVVKYALEEYRRTGGLGAWNPGAYDFYQDELPKRAKTKKFTKGK